MNAALGQEQGLNDHIKIAQQYFQVSRSDSECGNLLILKCIDTKSRLELQLVPKTEHL